MSMLGSFSIPAGELVDRPLTIGITMSVREWRAFIADLRDPESRCSRGIDLALVAEKALRKFDELTCTKFECGPHFEAQPAKENDHG